MQKRSISIICILLAMLSLSCERSAPDVIDNLKVSCIMPDIINDDVKYSSRDVVFSGKGLSYTVRTDENGEAVIPEMVPGIYNITTSWLLSSDEYNAMVAEENHVEPKIKVVIKATVSKKLIIDETPVTLDLASVVQRALMISKIYYSGTKDDMDRNYTTDSYVEIFNNSDETEYLDGKYMALGECESPAVYLAADNPDYIYARQIVKFPGSGSEYPVLPGESVVIAARSARNHTLSASSSVDLSSADFEVKQMDGIGNPDVKSLPLISNSTTTAYFNLIRGGGNSLFIFETDEDVLSWPEFYAPGEDSGERYRQVPIDVVLDGVECLRNSVGTGPEFNLKRLQDIIDAGAAYINSIGYTTESIERRVDRYENGRYYLVDTNNSTEDFVTIIENPEPRKYDKEGLMK